MSESDDDVRRGALSRAVVAAAAELSDDVAHGRVPWSENILLVQAGEDEDLEPTQILIKVSAPYLRAIQSHFYRNPLVLDAPSADGAAPVAGNTSVGTFGHADLVIFADVAPWTRFVPPDLDPATMVGRDFLDAERELTAAGWIVRAIADGDAVTADLNASRANIHYLGGDTPQGRTVYRTSIG